MLLMNLVLNEKKKKTAWSMLGTSVHVNLCATQEKEKATAILRMGLCWVLFPIVHFLYLITSSLNVGLLFFLIA